MNTHKWIVTIALVLALAMQATSVSAAGTASIALAPPTPNPGVIGSDVSFDLVLTANDINPGVAGAEIYLGYDPLIVAPPASPMGVAVALPDFFGVSDISIKEILPASQCPGGILPCVRLVVAGPPQTIHSGAAARFFFRGLAEGSACFVVLQSALVDADGYQVNHSPASPVCVTIVFRAIVKGAVQRQGTPANPNPGGGTRACSEVKSTSGATSFGPVYTDNSGIFTLANLPGGAHKLNADYSGYLVSEKSISISVSGPTIIDVGTTSLRGGDVNNDNKINILDIGTIISKFGASGVKVGSSNSATCSSVSSADEPADINDDGNINIGDLAITAGNWGLIGPTNWP